MPALVANYQKQQTVTQLRKMFSVLSTGFNFILAENDGSFPNDCASIGVQAVLEKYFRPHFKIVDVCTVANGKRCGYSSNNPFKGPNGVTWWNDRTIVLEPGFNGGIGNFGVILSDGTILHIKINNQTYCSFDIITDLNGSKGPNVGGKDVFYFAADSGKVRLKAWDDVAASCSKTGDGTFCGVKIQNDGWEIKDDYPW